MKRRSKIVIGAAAAALVVGLGAGAATAAGGGGDAPDVPLSGTDLQRASEAALAETGAGEVVDSEAESEENGYEVEVDLDDGRRVEVQLDADFAVVSTSEDDEEDDRDDD
jgi:hypothetical protein